MLSIDFFRLSAWALLSAERFCSCFLSMVIFSLLALSSSSWLFSWFCVTVFCLLRSLLASWQVFSVCCDHAYRESVFCACCCKALYFPVGTQDTATDERKTR